MASASASWAIELDGSFDDWRRKTRHCLRVGLEPGSCVWSSPDAPQRDLFAQSLPQEAPPRGAVGGVPKRFVEVARRVVCHRDPARWPLLYRLLWRLQHGERAVLEDATDPDVHRLTKLDQAVRRDAHKTKAFVRFKRVETPGGEVFLAWHRTDHLILPLVAPFFVDRFRPMVWSIFTPDASMHWDGDALRWGDGAGRDAVPQDDALEDLWRDYYRSIFNPARVKWRAMMAEMPAKHWATLPEARVIRELMREAPERVQQMVARNRVNASAWVPDAPSLGGIAQALPGCDACELCGLATGPVPGEGPVGAALALVGEQPGDAEDRAGRPFVGPAGRLLDEVLDVAEVPRTELYVTNAVKAFRFEQRTDSHGSPKRFHARPDAGHVEVCRPWLAAELEVVRPRVVLCLGATAGRSVVGRAVSIARDRGVDFGIANDAVGRVTYHPAAILRAPAARRAAMRDALAEDLKGAWAMASAR